MTNKSETKVVWRDPRSLLGKMLSRNFPSAKAARKFKHYLGKSFQIKARVVNKK